MGLIWIAALALVAVVAVVIYAAWRALCAFAPADDGDDWPLGIGA